MKEEKNINQTHAHKQTDKQRNAGGGKYWINYKLTN